jgi:hypothetical protein
VGVYKVRIVEGFHLRIYPPVARISLSWIRSTRSERLQGGTF